MWGERVAHGPSPTLIGDCLQGTREGSTEPEARQAAQGQAPEAHGHVLQPALQAQGGLLLARRGSFPPSAHSGQSRRRRGMAGASGNGIGQRVHRWFPCPEDRGVRLSSSLVRVRV